MGALSVIACAKIADLEGSSDPPVAGETESPTHLAGDVVISPASLEFGPVTCGTKATPQTITIRNTTAAAIPYEAKLPEGSSFVIDGPATGEIPPNETVTLSVTVEPTSPTDVSGGIVISAGSSFTEVIAHAVGRGAVLEFVPNLVEFGQVRINTAAELPVELKNTGSAPATVTAFTGGTEALSVPVITSLVIPAGGSVAVNAIVRAPGTPKTVEATLAPSVSSATCGELPALKLRAQAIDTNVTLSVADFGTVSCNAPEATREVTISNYSPTPITLTNATFQTTSRFEVVTSLPLEVGASKGAETPGTAQLVVRSKPVGGALGVAEEALSLTFTGAEMSMYETKARIDVRGAILEINPSELTFRSNGWYTDQKSFPIKNTGNAAITVAYDFVRTEGPAAWYPERSNDTIAPGQNNQTMSLGFRPSRNGTHRATMTPRRISGAEPCTPMPVASATGIGF